MDRLTWNIGNNQQMHIDRPHVVVSPKIVPATIALLCMIGGLAAPAAAARGQNKEIYAVPIPGEVQIDGSLDDWDLSGMIENSVVPETKATQSARIAMMYDDESLYVGGIVRDSSPMMNRHDPMTKPSRAWDADVCQIFFGLDPDEKQPLSYSSFKAEHKHVSPVATMMLWYFTDRQEPSLAMFRGMGFIKALNPDLHENGHIPGEHFDAAYRKGEAGLSYTFEYRIPWKVLSVKRVPKAEDTLAASVAVFWGRPDGLETAGGASWAWNVMAEPGFPFQSTACWGSMKFTERGDIPREWVTADLPPEQPLPLEFTYEMPREGECTVQLFDEKNRSVRRLVAQQRRPEGVNTERWDGLDDDGNPLPPGTYTWRGIVHDPVEMKYRFSVHNSGTPPYPTDDNTGGWGGDHANPTTVLAIEDGMILAWHTCEYGWGIIRTDLDGDKKWGSSNTADYLATDGKRLYVAGGHGWSSTAGVKVLDLKDSRALNFRPGLQALPAPAGGEGKDNEVTGLACDGQLIYVAYAGRDLVGVYDLKGGLKDTWKVEAPRRIDPRPDGSLAVISNGRVVAVKEGQVSVLVDGPLAEPRGLAVNDEGEIFVAQAGDIQQVRVFSADGEPLRTVGKAGGRPAVGRYDPAGMYEPGGIDIDDRGRVWVAETTDGPKRISVWDAETGKNVDEFFGSSGYFAYGHIDPARPNEIYAHHVLWKIDWDNYTAEPYTTVWRKTRPNQLPPIGPSAYVSHPRMITADSGAQFMYGKNRAETMLMMRDGDVFKPIAAILELNRRGRHNIGISVMNDDPERFPNGTYFWQDTNDDQIVQPDEVVRMGTGREYGKMDLSIDEDLSLYLNKGLRLNPVRVVDGRPVYDFAKAEKVPVWHAPMRDGYVYPDYAAPTIARIDPETGERLWRYAGITMWKRALGKPPVGPGRLWGTTGLLGVAGEYVGYMTYFGVNHLFHSETGVYVACLLEDGRVSLGRGAYQGQPEGQGGSFVKLSLHGEDRYFVIHGGQDSRVWEVLGLETVEQLSGGTYEQTPEKVAAAREALAEWEAAKAGRDALVIARGRDALDEATPVIGEVDENRKFEARAAYDAENLYLHYQVSTPNPLTNAKPEQELIFRGGNCLDLQIATDPDADPDREGPAPGDVRVLITRRDGKPFAMVYRPKVEGFDGEPTVFRSPTGTEPFDQISATDHVKLASEKTDAGFTAVAAIPLELLSWKPQPGQSVRLDIGYIFGNPKGTRTLARAYWSNNGFSANVVDDVPNESRLEPDAWGTAVVE